MKNFYFLSYLMCSLFDFFNKLSFHHYFPTFLSSLFLSYFLLSFLPSFLFHCFVLFVLPSFFLSFLISFLPSSFLFLPSFFLLSFSQFVLLSFHLSFHSLSYFTHVSLISSFLQNHLHQVLFLYKVARFIQKYLIEWPWICTWQESRTRLVSKSSIIFHHIFCNNGGNQPTNPTIGVGVS